MRVIGLTGGIAAGKSTVSEILSKLGAEIIDADKIGHQIYLPNTEAWKDIIAAFGEDILLPDKTVNRPKLGSIVFNDKAALKKLNQIVHPRMYKKFEEEIEIRRKKNKNKGVVALDAAILIEADWLPLVDQVWVVAADQDAVIDRLCSRNGFTKERARARISSQLSDEERRRYAHVVIENNGTLEEVEQRVYEAWNRTCL